MDDILMRTNSRLREAVCDCNYDIASEDWFNYIEAKCQKTLTDYEQEMLNEKFTEERNRYPKRLINHKGVGLDEKER